MYSSVLTVNSSTYSRDCVRPSFYYEALQVNVDETGLYRVESNSHVDTYGYIYKDSFNPFNPFQNLVSQNDANCGEHQFRLITLFQASKTYVLVVTTYAPYETGPFSIFVSGSNNVSLKHISEYLYYFARTQHKSTECRKCL
jgi:hypothetical protein